MESRAPTPDGLKPKDLIGIPWRVAFALQADGWYLRQDIIWHKKNPMPESVRDRCTKAHEYIFLLSKSPRYYFDHEAIKEPSSTFEKEGPRQKTQPNGLRADEAKKLGGFQMQVTETRNKRSVWTVTTKPFKGAHFATFPPDLIEPCILAGCPEGAQCWTRLAAPARRGLSRLRPAVTRCFARLIPNTWKWPARGLMRHHWTPAVASRTRSARGG